MHYVTVTTAIVGAALLVPSGAAAAPANDDFEHAAPLGGPPAEIRGSTEARRSSRASRATTQAR
jgi:hypothetical protein